MSNKKIDVQADFLFSLVLVVLLVVFFIALIGYKPVARRAPLVVMIPLSLMVLGEVVRTTKRLRSVKRKNSTQTILPKLDKKKLKRAILILAWLIILLVIR